MERQVKGVGVPVFISGDVTSAAVAAATARTATYLRANMVVRWVAGESWLLMTPAPKGLPFPDKISIRPASKRRRWPATALKSIKIILLLASLQYTVAWVTQ